jgi:lactoylglutathione lyase
MAYTPVQGLFETHLTVSNLQRSINFYQDIVGLQLDLEISERDAAFFWIGNSNILCLVYGHLAVYLWV